MKIAANYCVYNEADYIGYSLKSIYSFVDKIVILISDFPWKGTESLPDETLEIIYDFPDPEKKLIIKEGQWQNQETERNDALAINRYLKMDYYWVIDADEIYDAPVAKKLVEEIERHPEIVNFYCAWWTYWRSFYYRIEPPETSTFIIGRIVPSFKFKYARQPNKGPTHRIDCFFHHYSYARSFERIRRKMTNISGPGSPVRTEWLRKFEDWPQHKEIENLHPYWTNHWKKAVRITWGIPEALKDHPWSKMEIIR